MGDARAAPHAGSDAATEARWRPCKEEVGLKRFLIRAVPLFLVALVTSCIGMTAPGPSPT